MVLKEVHSYAESSISCDLRISLLEIHTEFQGVLKSQNNPKEKQIWRLTSPDFETHSKVTATKTVWSDALTDT